MRGLVVVSGGGSQRGVTVRGVCGVNIATGDHIRRKSGHSAVKH